MSTFSRNETLNFHSEDKTHWIENNYILFSLLFATVNRLKSQKHDFHTLKNLSCVTTKNNIPQHFQALKISIYKQGCFRKRTMRVRKDCRVARNKLKNYYIYKNIKHKLLKNVKVFDKKTTTHTYFLF